MFGSLAPTPRHIKLFVVWFFCLLAAAFVFSWVWYTYKTRVEMEMLKTQLDTALRERAVVEKSMQDQLDVFYRTLYTDPEVKVASKTPVPVRQPSTVELWQRNRDKELRDRILRLERSRLDLERRLNEMR